MPQNNEYKQGLIFAFSAYIMWGLAPLYFKMLVDIAPLDIVLQRVVWSFAFILIIIGVSRRMSNVLVVLKQPKKVGLLVVTSALIGGNWLVFIWAVNTGHMLDASLGYYINPILNVVLGVIFLSEKLRKMQWFAVAIAVFAVLIELVAFGSVPWISLVLASSFGCYGLLRKKIAADALSGLFIETLILMPVALGYLFFVDSHSLELINGDVSFSLLIIASGVVTTLPLLAFSAAAIRIPLSTLGFIQYIGPSIMMSMAVMMYGESLSASKVATFAFIWLALIVYTFDGIKHSKKNKRALASK